MVTLTYFTTRSTSVVYAFEWVKLLKCQLKGKTCRKLANGQDIDDYEKNGPRALSAPLLGLFSVIFKHVYWYIQHISGERLQDQCSSGSICFRSLISFYQCNNYTHSFSIGQSVVSRLNLVFFSLPCFTQTSTKTLKSAKT